MQLALVFILGFIAGSVIALVAKHLADNPRPDILLMQPESEQRNPEGNVSFEFDKEEI